MNVADQSANFRGERSLDSAEAPHPATAAPPIGLATAAPKMTVFVHLAYGFSAEHFHAAYVQGKLIGINEPYAYGYHRAAKYGCNVEYSTDHPEGRLAKLVRYAARFVLGFDLVHAFRNRKTLFRADAVWTHTESQSLAVAAILRLKKRHLRPKTVFQNVWLIDQWDNLDIAHRSLYKWLLGQADLLTFLSALNKDRAKAIFPGIRVEHVLFGIRADHHEKFTETPSHTPIRVLAVGNDKHRDWETLRQAVLGDANFELRVITKALPPSYLTGNAAVLRVNENTELLEHYRWADIAVVPLKPNLHASGITAIQEAVIQGVPVISSDVGGLQDYFGPDAVAYVPAKDPQSLRQAITDLYADAPRRKSMVTRAQLKMVEGDLNSEAFARRHVELSRELMAQA